MMKDKNSKMLVNYWKLVYFPLTIALISIMVITYINVGVNKYLLIWQMKTNGLVLAKENVLKIQENKESIETINQLLDEKLRMAGAMVIENKDKINDEFLTRLQKKIGIDEVNWFSNTGEIIYSNFPKHKGWKVSHGHPLYYFIHSEEEELIEDIRKDAITGEAFKYGAIKINNGEFVQIGILAENIEKLIEKYSYQILVNRLVDEENIVHAKIVDKNLMVIADGENSIGQPIYDEDKEALKRGFGGKSSAQVVYHKEKQEKVLDIVSPIIINDEINYVLLIGLSMKPVYNGIYLNYIISISIGVITFLLFLWIQNKNVSKPARQLNNYINEVDMEKDISYRIKVHKKDTFEGLAISINKILDKANNYFHELEAAYGQLKASEEALQIQYDEIQNYTEKLEDLKQRYEISIKGTNSAVWGLNLEDEKLYISKELYDILGRDFVNNDHVDKVLESLLRDDDKTLVISEFLDYINKKKSEINLQIKLKDIEEIERIFLLKGTGIFDKDKNLKSINGVLYDITQIKKQKEKIKYMAYHDSLTELPNRRSFMEMLQEEIDKGNKGFVMLLDIDNFKSINDTNGHIYGDKVLKKVASILESDSDENIMVFRFGGDEFLIISKGDNIEAVEKYIEKIKNIFKENNSLEDYPLYITFSIGITKYPQDGNDINQLMINADTAMYVAKSRGKNRHLFFDERMIEKFKGKIKIENILRNALKKEKFILMYQPQVSVETGEVVGFEALLRLKEENISPAEFIPIAEETGMIIDLGRCVTKTVIQQMEIWKNKGFKLKPVSINFSTIQLRDKEYHQFLKETLEKHGIDPKYLEIEITESILLEKTEGTLKYLNQFKELGVSIALDDFGTGYSSLNYLTYIPIDKVKLDKSLNDKFLLLENIKVMDSIISLVHSLGLKITAEGIEEMEQYKRLKVAGCDYIQGYLFSKPLSVEEAEKIYNHKYL